MYLVIEIQTSDAGVVSNIVQSYSSRAEAESRYYTIMASACISSIAIHSVVLMTNEGFTIMSNCYKHSAT